jgi:hypothetical protein
VVKDYCDRINSPRLLSTQRTGKEASPSEGSREL